MPNPPEQSEVPQPFTKITETTTKPDNDKMSVISQGRTSCRKSERKTRTKHAGNDGISVISQGSIASRRSERKRTMKVIDSLGYS